MNARFLRPVVARRSRPVPTFVIVVAFIAGITLLITVLNALRSHSISQDRATIFPDYNALKTLKFFRKAVRANVDENLVQAVEDQITESTSAPAPMLSQILPHKQAEDQLTSMPLANPKLHILYFTMDSLTTYIESWKRGGPGGEIVVGRCFHEAVRALGHTITIANSDSDFAAKTRNTSIYDLFVFDQDTIYVPGLLPRAFLPGRQNDILVINYFGTIQYPLKGLPNLPAVNILTAMSGNSPPFTFLGMYMENGRSANVKMEKENFGLYWGKEQESTRPPHNVFVIAAQYMELQTNFRYSENASLTNHIGVLSREKFISTLKKAKFLLGTGDPILGPAGIEAIEEGCLLIIPRFDPPKLIHNRLPSLTQHDFAVARAPKDRVCLYDLSPPELLDSSLRSCMRQALALDTSTSYVFPEFTWSTYKERVGAILNRFL